MAVPNDLINTVLKDFYASKEKQASGQTGSKNPAAESTSGTMSDGPRNAEIDGSSSKESRPKDKEANKYEAYKKDSYSYKEEAYEVYPEYYDPYGGSYDDPYASNTYIPPLMPPVLDQVPGPYRHTPPNFHGALPRNAPPNFHQQPPRHPSNFYGPRPRHTPMESSGYPIRPPNHYGPRPGLPRQQPSTHNFDPSHDERTQNMKRRLYENTSSEYAKRNKLEDFGYINKLFDFGKLPSMLTDMFTLNTCHLCLITIITPGMMELHYRGKSHVKRVKGWMYANKSQHNLSVDEIETIGQLDMFVPGDPHEGEKFDLKPDEDARYCTVCNIPISSAAVAKQHYSGKKHLKAVQISKMHADRGDAHVDAVVPPKTKASGPAKSNPRWYCHICKVASTTEDQYEIHLNGKRHKKAWKESQVVIPVGASLAMSTHQNLADSSADMFLPEELEGQYDVSLYCLRCREYFSTQPERTYHSCANETLVAGELFCRKCKTAFDTRPELKYHDCPGDHYCETCDRYFDASTDVLKHSCDEAPEEKNEKKPAEVESNLQSSSFYCTLCRKELNSAIGLNDHGKGKLHRTLLYLLKRTQGISLDFNPFRTQARIQYHCDQCDINFSNDGELSAHMKRGQHMIPLSREKECKEAEEAKPEPVVEPGAYDIRNVDVNALMKEYYKH